MASGRAAFLRRVWMQVHLWIGVGLGLLLIPIALSGALLVWHDEVDGLINPARYAVSGSATAQPPSAYFASAATALEGARPTVLRYPEHDGAPVTVLARGAGQSIFNVYLDPPTARVLDVADFRNSFMRWMHRFHENLTIPEYSGRAVVGWVGVAMLISSLTGIWLWWPRSGTLARALRWRRSSSFNMNLHHMLGFWIAIPLAVVSLTGVYLGFPQQARSALGAVAAMSPQGPRPFGTAPLRQTAHTSDQALAIALTGAGQAKPAAIFVPTVSRDVDRGERPQWRVQLRTAAGLSSVLIDDATGNRNEVKAGALPGDRAAQWIRWIHEGSHSGALWRVIVFLCGLFPPIFVVTGIIMWLRRSGRAQRQDATAHLRPAE